MSEYFFKASNNVTHVCQTLILSTKLSIDFFKNIICNDI